MSKKPYYITTAITYTSGKPHIGNTYEIILADSIARYKRMEGYDVFFQTGTDEHGQKVELKAEEKGVTPKESAPAARMIFQVPSHSKDTLQAFPAGSDNPSKLHMYSAVFWLIPFF